VMIRIGSPPQSVMAMAEYSYRSRNSHTKLQSAPPTDLK
jgi:hypothetical protein